MRIRHFCGFNHLLVGGILAAVTDVVFDRSAEQEGFLKHDSHCIAERFRAQIPDIDPVDPDRSGRDIKETHQQRGNGGFSASGGTDERDFLPGFHIQRKLAQNPFCGFVAELHFVKFQSALRIFQRARVLRLFDLRHRIQQFADTLHRDHPGADHVRHTAQGTDRTGEHSKIGIIGDQLPDRHLSGSDIQRSKPEEQHDPGNIDHF